MDYFASKQHRSHDALELNKGALRQSVETPRRAEIIATALQALGHQQHSADALDLSLVKRVHTAEYVDFLASAWSRWEANYGSGAPAMAFSWPNRTASKHRPNNLVGQLGYHSFAADCSIVEGTWEAVSEAAALAHSAADRLAQGTRAVYALCRPPGHHATSDQFGGYCYLNNSAIAAQRLLDHGATRVAILDIDYHHGNGTQDIFYHRADVLTLSVHADPMFEFPWFSGHADETGSDDGDGWNMNLPLPAGANYQRWEHAVDTALKRIASSKVDQLVVALGVDTFVDDPLGTFEIDTHHYALIGQRIAALNLPTLIVQEGGYAVEAIGDNVSAFLSPFN